MQLKDDEFCVAMRFRLGLPVVVEQQCDNHNLNAKSGVEDASKPTPVEYRGRFCDSFGDHCIMCGKGANKYRVHKAVQRRVDVMMQEAGMETEMECVFPELLQGEPGSPEAVEARADNHGWASHVPCTELWTDVAVVRPWKITARNTSCQENAKAARDAEERKRRRYGEPVCGVGIEGVAL